MSESRWQYPSVTIQDIKHVDAVAIGFENAEVITILKEAISRLIVGNPNTYWQSTPNKESDLNSIPIMNHVSITLDKNKIMVPGNMLFDDMYGASDEENYAHLQQHWDHPDIAGVTLFDDSNKLKAQFSVSWSNHDSHYLNTDVVIKDTDDTLSITIIKPVDKEY